jgi:hypothetical protein
MRKGVFVLLRVSAGNLPPGERDLYPLPRAIVHASSANRIKTVERLRMSCIRQRYRSLMQHVCEPRHACATVFTSPHRGRSRRKCGFND